MAVPLNGSGTSGGAGGEWYAYLRSLGSAVEVEVAQLRKRYGSSFKTLTSDDTISFSIQFHPTAPDFPNPSVKEIGFPLIICLPKRYPNEPAMFFVQGLSEPTTRAVERYLNGAAEKAAATGTVNLRGILRKLDRELFNYIQPADRGETQFTSVAGADAGGGGGGGNVGPSVAMMEISAYVKEVHSVRDQFKDFRDSMRPSMSPEQLKKSADKMRVYDKMLTEVAIKMDNVDVDQEAREVRRSGLKEIDRLSREILKTAEEIEKGNFASVQASPAPTSAAPAPSPAGFAGLGGKDAAVELKEQGNQCFTKGDYQGAEAYYRRALELDPENLAFLDNLSAALVRLNKWEEVVSNATRVLEMSAGVFPRASFKRALAYEALGNRSAALSDCKNLIAQGIKTAEVTDLHRRLLRK